MTKKEVKEIIIREYVEALKMCEDEKHEVYRAGINYFAGWLCSSLNINLKDLQKATEDLYK